ncbi:MAG: hypothetical protein VB144_05040 [Clostridia bacterium]|nr:hypothetical protein [Clostridia bacterium]
MRDDVALVSRALEQVDTLILLVGGNPLPNAVSAKALLANGGHVVLVESRETKGIADRLAEHLRREQVLAPSLEHTCVEPDDPRDVRLHVNSILRTVPSDHRVGLNYTGGTKVMVAHSYYAVREWAKENHRSVQFSYLSPDGLRMVVEPYDGCGPCLQFSLGTTVSMSFDDLLELHDWELAEAPRRSGTALGGLRSALIQMQCNEKARDDWRDTVVDPLRKALDRLEQAHSTTPAKASACENEVGSMIMGFPSTPFLANSLAEATGTVRGGGLEPDGVNGAHLDIRISDAARNAGFSNCRDFLSWLCGGWLEECAFMAFSDIAEECGLHDIMWNATIRAQHSQFSEDQSVGFEIDCVAMRGYQVFVVSCTRDKKAKIRKWKLFEAHMRATQLGGDEARFALVCTSDRPELVKEECRRDLLTEGQAPVEVFGARDLAFLPERLKKWILG